MFSTAFLDIPPLASAGGTVRLPGSKSISNRVLLLAGLCHGTTRVRDPLVSDDTQVMLDALRELGCRVEPGDRSVRIDGLGGTLRQRDAVLFVGNAGTAARSLTAALAVLATTQGAAFTLRGVPRMHERPIGDLVDALRSLGCAIRYLGADGFPPLRLGDGGVHRLRLEAPVRVRGDVSSQFLTGLLQALCLVAAEHAIVVEVEGELVSRPYVAITLNLLARFGVRVRNERWQRFTIPSGSRLESPGTVQVEGDASSASYFIAAGALAASRERPLRIEGMGRESIQGDLAFVGAAQAMGAEVLLGDNWVEVARGAWPLKPVTLDCNPLPDAAMTLAAMALFAIGTTRLTNIASWRVKETDRIAALEAELRRFGARVETGDDWIEVSAPKRWRAATIRTYDDHRIAMCCALAAFNPAGLPVRLLDPRCVAKTWPDFFETLFSVAEAPAGGIPVITVDGPTASGKGTLASAIAARLGYRFLDSGAVYRATALAAMRSGTRPDDEPRLAQLAGHLDLGFGNGEIRLSGQNVTETLRLEEVGALASKIAAFPLVRAALRTLQLSFRQLPGLVADGRDMGTVIFPGADLKVYLTATAATRAERRHQQLLAKNIAVSISDLRFELEARDARDQNRAVSPLRPAADAVLLDNSLLGVDTSVDTVLGFWEQRRPFSNERPRSADPTGRVDPAKSAD